MLAPPRIVWGDPTRRLASHLLIFLPWLVLLGYLTHTAWFRCDDAFISFRYARNLLEGHGLVFNPGEYVEGYSNFLWVLELAVLWGAFGLRPEHTAPWLSVACTIGTLAALLWWVGRLPGLPHRRLVAWMALGLVCSSATFAVWTSAGGLETRQFTLFVVLAVVGLTLYPENRRALLGVSLSLAAASLTRPEGPLFVACCFGWYAVQRRVCTGRWWPGWRDAAALIAPVVLLVAGHYLWRYGYYGEWLPNTYYAKYVRPWYEMGVRYLATAGLETGLYLLLPLAILTCVRDWRARQHLVFVLPLFCIGLHMAYVARIGGDRFGYRLLDVYWPLLAVPAAAGLVQLGRWLATGTRTCALALFLPVVFYCSGFQASLVFLGDQHHRISPLQREKKGIRWLLAVPGMQALFTLSDNQRQLLGKASTAVNFVYKRANPAGTEWQPYQNMERGIIPADALAFTFGVGARSYFLPDLKFIDYWGLTDTTIARHPVLHPNSRRKQAHDRSPPPGYLAHRGVNLIVHPAAASEEEALGRGVYGVQVGPDLWMPFDGPSLEWATARFPQLRYDQGADERFEATLKTARLLIRDVFDIYRDGDRLLYIKDRCDIYEPRVFLHVIPNNEEDLPTPRRQYGFDNLDFSIARPARLGTVQRCVAARTLPAYSIALVRTGQFHQKDKWATVEDRRIWSREFRLVESD